MNSIAASELIINNRGAIYHINTRPEELAHTIITVGDPDRVKEVSKYFDSIEFQKPAPGIYTAYRVFKQQTPFGGEHRYWAR